MGCKLQTFDFFAGEGFNTARLADALAQVPGKAIVLLNLPGNPTGYALTPAEADAVTDVLAAHDKPMVVVVDDAYQGFVYEDTALKTSEFWPLAKRLDPEKHAVFKVDGATKELLFFPGRVGFFTTPPHGGCGRRAGVQAPVLLPRHRGCPRGPQPGVGPGRPAGPHDRCVLRRAHGPAPKPLPLPAHRPGPPV